uniref:Uncharacterized protein n=1 Tax=Heterorhabditis bacteriophora TaxID=37862 RepID=A0A1I7X3V1_HETBA
MHVDEQKARVAPIPCSYACDDFLRNVSATNSSKEVRQREFHNRVSR